MAHHAIVETVTIRVDRFKPWLPQLVNATAAVGGVAPEALVGPSRCKPLVRLRQAYALAARDVLEKSFPQIARAMGRADHTSLWHSYENGREHFAKDPEFNQLASVLLGIAREISRSPIVTIEIEPELPL